MSSLILITLFIVLLFLGIPISFVLAAASTIYIAFTGVLPLEAVPHKMWNALDQFVYTAIPLFMFTGELMNETEITDRLMRVAAKCVGWIAGGLAHVVVLTCFVISGIGGSAVADAVAVGSVLIPAMAKEGYRRDFASALVAASAVLGPIIPPSNAMVIYSAILGISVGALFCAGIIPGVIIAVSLMAVCYSMALRGKIPRKGSEAIMRQRLKPFSDVVLPLSLPIIMIGGVLSGVATATEIAAVSVFVASLVGFIAYRNLTIKKFLDCAYRAVVPTCVIFLLISASGVLGIVTTILHVPQEVSSWILDLTQNKILVLLVMNLFLLFMGTLMDASVNLLILAPILAPIAVGLGLHPLHFALVFIFNVSIGLVTPPVGSLLFTVCPIGRVSMQQVVIKVIPFVVIEFVGLLIITYVPETVLWLPRILGFL